MSRPIIKAEGLGKRYAIKVGESSSYRSLREGIQLFFTQPLKSLRKKTTETFWALQNVNFGVNQGEVIGIIGPNGAGKSTLLKILSRITMPTEGRVSLRGRVGALLEVGTGFHPELSGRENIFLSGTILGMKRYEINRQLEEIVSFAGVEQFLDTPVKRYSSGMRVRLGFAVAAHLASEILIIDEVLAVGDASFQKKCLGRIDEVAESGRTVLFVSHNLGMVKQLCPKTMLLNNGKMELFAETNQAISVYKETITQNLGARKQVVFVGPLGSQVRLVDVWMNGVSYRAGGGNLISALKPLEIRVSFEAKLSIPMRINLGLYKDGIRIFTLQDVQKPAIIKERVDAMFIIPAKLLRPGLYTIGTGGVENFQNSRWFWARDFAGFQVIEEWTGGIERINYGIVNVFTETKRLDVE